MLRLFDSSVLTLCVVSPRPMEQSNPRYVLDVEWYTVSQCFYGKDRED